MKIKLNVSKDLKRQLKFKAKEKELDRNDYIYEIINNYVEEEKSLWVSEIDEIIEAASSDEINTAAIAKGNMGKTAKKLQPIILNVDEKTYYALEVIATNAKKTKEDVLINLLKNIAK